MRSKKINLILHDGTPYGVKTAELSNWNGKVIISSRSALKKIKELDEGEMPAVYFLLGDNNEIYVGESDSLFTRLANHALEKDFWKDMIAFTSPELSKTEVKYLEHVFIKRIKEDGLIELVNSKLPKSPSIKKEIQDAMEDFVDHCSDIILSLGYDFMGVSDEIENNAALGTVVSCSGPDAKGLGIWSDNGLLVKKGSLARIDETNTFPASGKRLRGLLISNGVLKQENNNSYIFTTDHLFGSASSASDVLLARSSNGLTEWKNKEGKTIKELEQE